MGTQEPPSSGGTPAESEAVEAGQPRHTRNLPVEEPAARFHERERPNRYAGGLGHLTPQRPLDPVGPYTPPPVARRRRSDWSVMMFAMVITSIVMVGCCLAGFAIYSAYGNPFAK
jgi:hypothetical protein